MAIQSRTNQYRGVNAHLHSHYQNRGGWEGFHGKHVGDLAEAISNQLPPGYAIDTEQSLQIREYHPDTGERLLRPQPDLAVYTTKSSPSDTGSSPTVGAVATLTQPVIKTFEADADAYLTALVIYETLEANVLGRPVTRMELLSPSNKYGAGEWLYRKKRATALKSGLRLVEIDYLHETPSPVNGVPRYPRNPESHPYSITISDPTPSLQAGLATTYSFNVDDPIPTLDIPLLGAETFALDFNVVYRHTFKSVNAYSLRVDYEQSPEHLDTYSPADQERIWRRMQAVKNAHERGLNLDDAPFPLEGDE